MNDAQPHAARNTGLPCVGWVKALRTHRAAGRVQGAALESWEPNAAARWVRRPLTHPTKHLAVLVAAFVCVFATFSSLAQPSEAPDETEQTEDAEVTDAPSEEADTPRERRRRRRQSDSDAGENEEADDDGIAVNLQGADLQQISRFLMDQLGKPVVAGEGLGEVELSVMAPDRMPLNEALELLGNALRAKGVVIVRGERVTQLLPVAAVRQMPRALVGPDESVADLPDSSVIVDKVFALEFAAATNLQEAVVAMLPDYAFLTADPNLNTLTVTAAAADLVQIERQVARLDVEGAGASVERIFRLEHGDPAEVANLVRAVLAGRLGIDAGAIYVSPLGGEEAGGGNRGRNNNRGRNSRNNRGNDDTGPGTLTIERSDAPILLTPDVARRWIIASAPPRVMDQIARWVAEFDVPAADREGDGGGQAAGPPPPPYELVQVKFGDVEELAEQLATAIGTMPDPAVRDGVRVVPFPKSDRLLVYGSARGRELVGTLLDELDVEVDLDQVFEEITLVNAPAETVKAKIEELFDDQEQSGRRRWWSRGSNTKKELTVSADPQRNTITIKTDRARMRQIKELIEDKWDTPLDYGEVQPRVYTLKHTDPVQVQTLLEEMFSKSTSSSSFNWFSGSRETTTNASVGRLFGQFSFQALADSNKLIVSTKNVGNYQVIDELIDQLDVPQDAGLPILVDLKHANAEDVAEQLNAMFSEPGTPASVTRNERGLSDEIRRSATAEENQTTAGNNNGNNNRGGGGGGDGEVAADQMSFWWSQSRPNPNEQATSNLIGKPRFVPVNRRNAIMILAPRAHAEPFRDLVAELDEPGSQVMIHAVISEITHDDESTLGVRLASDPSILSDSRLADQAIGGTVAAAFSDTFANGDGVLNAGLNVNVLLQLLVKKLNLKILNEPRLATADNQEAHFFDGQDVPVITGDQETSNSNQLRRSFRYRAIGTRLHVRPHITQEGDVDMEVNLELSRIVNGTSVFGNFIFDRRETTTHVTVRDGQTLVISGIVRQEDFNEVRKFPILGDIPLLGLLFRSTDRQVRNREVIAFITPYVVDRGDNSAENASEENQRYLDRVRGATTTPPVPKDERRDPDDPDSPGLTTTPGERDLNDWTR